MLRYRADGLKLNNAAGRKIGDIKYTTTTEFHSIGNWKTDLGKHFLRKVECEFGEVVSILSHGLLMEILVSVISTLQI